MHLRTTLRGPSAFAALALAATGLVGLASTASASTTFGAHLHHGVLTIHGTSGVDLLGVVTLPPEIAIDFGLDGTVEKRIAISRVRSIDIHTAGGNDAIHLTGTGMIPLSIDTGAGSDFVSARGITGVDGATDAPTTITTGSGKDDVISATPGAITIDTGSGPDFVEAGAPGVGTESVSMGRGDDTFSSAMDPSLGARDDVVDAGPGANRMSIIGSTASESLAISGRSGHLLTQHRMLGGRTAASVDATGIAHLFYTSNGGPKDGAVGDRVTVGDLTGTGLVDFTPDFSSNIEQTQPNQNRDRLVVTGTDGVDNVAVSGTERHITVSGLATQVTPVWLTTPDTLVIDTLGGDDTVDTSGLEEGLVRLQIH